MLNYSTYTAVMPGVFMVEPVPFSAEERQAIITEQEKSFKRIDDAFEQFMNEKKEPSHEGS